tara:strand:- start:367 stop:732 length:366 start_codon:yes stop_codon:yes gene_type:complete
MENYEFKNLQGAALQKRWENLASKDDWDSILELTTERLNYLYEDFQKEGIADLKKEEALTRVFVANTICACHSLLKLIKTLDKDIFVLLEEIEAKEREDLQVLTVFIEKLEERINKLETKN